MVSKEVDIDVVVIGPAGSGKTSLTARFHKDVYRRSADDRSFRFILSEHDGSSSGLWKEFQFALVTLDLTQADGSLYSDVIMLARRISKSARQPGMVCILVTKVDSLAQDTSKVEYWTIPTRCTFVENLQCYGVSAFDGTGISEVQNFIVDQVYPLKKMTYPSDFRPFFGRISSWLLDTVARLFSLPVPDNVNQQTPDPLELDDSMVNTLVRSPEAVAWGNTLRAHTAECFVSTHRITPTLLAKEVNPSERENMTYIRQHTTIPVPQPRYPRLSSWLVMDLVKGRMLLDCWDMQSAFMRFRIACTMRVYISQLQRLRGSIPGTVAGGIVSGVLFEHEDRGPFQDFTRFRQYYEMVSESGWASSVRARRSIGSVQPLPHPPTGVGWPLVFTHGDLNLGNIMLSDDGVLWIVDWETSGFFPPWLETVGLRYYHSAPKSWQRFRWFMAGSYPNYEQLWDFFMDDVHRYTPSQWSNKTNATSII